MFNGEILVCEDNNVNQRVALEHLAKVGIKAEIAENGRIGVEKVRKRIADGDKPYDLIFMDINMPVMDGVEATPKILALGSGAPIVAMTANIMPHEIANYKRLGMSDVIGKPYTSQELWRCLLKYMKPVGFASANVDKAGEEEFQNKLKVIFAKSNRNKFDEIVEAIETGDIALAHRLAHTLKANAGLIGNLPLEAAAADVERSLKDGCLVTGAQMNLLESRLAKALVELEPLLEEYVDPASPSPLGAEQTLALIDKLEPLLKNRNMECVEFLDTVRAIPGAGELARQIGEYDFKTAYHTLQELKRNWK